jgi:hypothetical protein
VIRCMGGEESWLSQVVEVSGEMAGSAQWGRKAGSGKREAEKQWGWDSPAATPYSFGVLFS